MLGSAAANDAGKRNAALRIGVFCPLDYHPELGRPHHERYAQVLDQAEQTERAGLESFWVAEHHFSDYGIGPDPAVLLAAVAARTQRIRLGTAAAVLPLHTPLRLAESLALVDQLSHGRLECGVASGYLHYEFEGFGQSLAQRRERFDEALAIVRRAWRGGPVNFAGEHFQVAAPPLNVQPLQAGGPPLHIAVTRPAVVPHVGRKGLGLLTIPYVALRDLTALREAVAAYRGTLPADARGAVTAALHVFCAEGPDDPALDLARAALERYLRTRVVPGARYAGTPPAEDFVLFGDAAALAPRLRALDALGLDRLLALADFGGLSPRLVAGSLMRLGGLAAG